MLDKRESCSDLDASSEVGMERYRRNSRLDYRGMESGDSRAVGNVGETERPTSFIRDGPSEDGGGDP